MKKVLLIHMLLLALGAFGQIPSYVPQNGLVGWWPFNGNANDESGNGYNGIVNDATLTADRFGIQNAAYYFNGINNSINLITTLPISFSINAWVNTNSYKSYILNGGDTIGEKLISTYNNNYGFTGFECALDGKPSNYGKSIAAFWCNNNCNALSSNNSIMGLGSWYNLTITYGNGVLRYFINGNLTDTVLSSYVPNLRSVFLGAREYYNNGPAFFFNGKFDDIGIWNRALIQQEITNLYYASTTPPPCPSLPSNLQTGLVGYWPFCGNANDASGNGNNGTVNGASLAIDRFGNWNSAYSFNGTDNYITANTINFPTTNQPRTISVWFKVNRYPNPDKTYILMNYGTAGNNQSCGLAIDSILDAGTRLNFFAWNNSDVIDTNQYNLGAWHNMVGTYDGITGKLYFDGALVASKISNWNTSISTFTIGKNNQTNGSMPYFFDGTLDDICIWNRALDYTEIAQLYQTQSTSSSNGNVGINVAVPQRSLHISDVIRLEPRNTAPDNPVKGDIYFDGVLNKLRVYDGTQWQNCW